MNTMKQIWKREVLWSIESSLLNKFLKTQPNIDVTNSLLGGNTYPDTLIILYVWKKAYVEGVNTAVWCLVLSELILYFSEFCR